MTNYGAYLIENNNQIELFIFKELSEKELKECFPLSYKEGCKYFGAIVSNDIDFVGGINFKDIQDTLKNKKNVQLIEHKYNECLKVFPDLSINLYNKYFDILEGFF
tara:strand:+ start:92 stop:409 length:318 start_codon:yes stop_codon:yes gene_type:complete